MEQFPRILHSSMPVNYTAVIAYLKYYATWM